MHWLLDRSTQLTDLKRAMTFGLILRRMLFERLLPFPA
jgi:hypothetical protein